MSNELIAAIMLGFIFGGGILFFIVTECLCEWNYYRKQKKIKENCQEFIRFRDEYEKWHSSMNLRWEIRRRKEKIDKWVEEMKYYPTESEKYYLLKSKIEDARRFIDKAEDEDKRDRSAIYQFVVDNKPAIDSIKEYNEEVYDHWMTVYERAVKELEGA